MVYQLSEVEWTHLLILVCLFFIKIETAQITSAEWYDSLKPKLRILEYPWIFGILWTVAKASLLISWFLFWQFYVHNHTWSNTVMSLYLTCIVLTEFYPFALLRFPNWVSFFSCCAQILASFTLMLILYEHFLEKTEIAVLAMVFMLVTIFGTALDLFVSLHRSDFETEYTKSKQQQQQQQHKQGYYRTIQSLT